MIRYGLAHARAVAKLPLNVRSKCSISGNIIHSNGTGGFDLTFLGTSSQGGARRYPSCLALRLRGAASSQVWLFDAGEGATAQLQRSNMRMGLVRNIFITHMHGDHLFGLPGLVMCILGRRDEVPQRAASSLSSITAAATAANSSSSSAILSALSPDSYPRSTAIATDDGALHVYGPQGIRSFLRTALGVASFRVPSSTALYIHELIWPYGCGPSAQRSRHRRARPYWHRNVRQLPFEGSGRDIEPERSTDGEWTYRLIHNGSGDQPNIHHHDTSIFSSEQHYLDDKDKDAMRDRQPASVLAAPVLHTIPTFAYSVRENVPPRRFDKSKLNELGIPKDGRDEVRRLFSNWLSGESGVWNGQKIDISQVLQNGRPPRRLCVIGDTYDASPAAHIANDVDVLVHEATNVAAQTDMARRRGHSSTIGATGFAKKVHAKRLILNHTSVAYSDRKMRGLENEARAMFGSNRVFVARDLSVFSVPTEEEDGEDFMFRRFAGFADSIEYRTHLLSQAQAGSGCVGGGVQQQSVNVNPFSADFRIDDEDASEGDDGLEEDDKPDGDMGDDGDDDDDVDDDEDEDKEQRTVEGGTRRESKTSNVDVSSFTRQNLSAFSASVLR